jgi:hypothetical protein
MSPLMLVLESDTSHWEIIESGRYRTDRADGTAPTAQC